MFVYGGCAKFCLLETAILSQKKITLAKLSPYSQKTFAGPYVGLYLGILDIFGTNQQRDKGHSVAAAHSHVMFCFFHGRPCSPAPAQF